MEEQDLKGMTVNERLFVLGLMEDFDSAVKSRNKEASISVLLEAKFTPEQAEETVSVMFKNSKKYGY